jgi:protein-S-isoprenylcysteine O-methyltransferase Ste14
MLQPFSLQAVVGGGIQLLLFPLVLFLTAGTFIWPACWIFLLFFYSFVYVVVQHLVKNAPVLLEERMSVFKAAPQRDWMFLILLAVALLWLVVMPLDVVRFRWSHLPLALQVLGVPALVGSLTLMYLAFRVNAYVTPTVRIQQERGQTVVSNGPYRSVRHPMYAGFLLFFLSLPLLLGSVGGLILAPLPIALVARRAVLEERLLCEKLPGYSRYLMQVRFRLIPHLW